MPLYDFRCTACCYEFERLLSLRDNQSNLRCPECDSEVRRLISTFSTPGGKRLAALEPAQGAG